MLERFLQERCLVVIVDVRTYDQGVTSKKVENYPLEEGIENTEENLGILTEVNQVYDSESMQGRVMRDNRGGDGSRERRRSEAYGS